jgi:predicted AlkP superfamily pyrophosphatase or phosphodiesterase
MVRAVSMRRSFGFICSLLILFAGVSGCRTGRDGDRPRAAAPQAGAASGGAPAAGTPSTGAPTTTGDAATPSGGPAPALILLSFDGFRWDYDTKVPTPNIQKVIARGVRAARLIPSFPSKTFPNHYTIVTGLYPAHHGIVGNTMWDPAMEASFTMSDRAAVTDGRWWGGEPLWVTVERQGLIAATMFWPGSEAKIGGIRPRIWMPYVAPLPSDDARVDQVLAWLDLPAAERPSLLTAYFSDADSAGHEFGPESPELRAAVTKIDGEIGRLTAGLASRGLLDRVNLVMTADHGMAATSPDRVIVLSDYVDLQSVQVVDINPTLGLIPRGPGVSVDDLMRRLATAHPHLHMYRKADTPAHWHYRDNPRIPPVTGVADEGWTVIKERPKQPQDPARNRPGVGGTHGYDPTVTAMHALFVAAGPAFRRGVTVPPFENIHIYNALATALHVRPAPNDGDPAIAQRLLAIPVARPASAATHPTAGQ